MHITTTQTILLLSAKHDVIQYVSLYHLTYSGISQWLICEVQKSWQNMSIWNRPGWSRLDRRHAQLLYDLPPLSFDHLDSQVAINLVMQR